MNDQEMRDHVDQVLAELEQKLRRRRRSKFAMAGSAAGLALALDACFKVVDLYGVAPEYGVEVDAGDAAVQDAQAGDTLGQDLVTLYGFQDAAGFEAAVRYGVQCDAGLPDLPPVDARYGIGC